MTIPDPDATALEELLAGHALGDLDEAEQERVQRWLEADPSLRHRLDELNTTLRLLPLALGGEERPPERLRRRLLEPTPPQERPRPAHPRWGTLVTAAMACSLVVMGVQLHQMRQQLAVRDRGGGRVDALGAPSSPPPAPRILVLRGTGADPRTSAQVVVQPERGFNTLRVSGLPPAPPRHVYRLWADVEGRTVGCVRFLPDREGRVAMPIPTEPTGSARGLRITLEPLLPDGEQPQGPSVLTSV